MNCSFKLSLDEIEKISNIFQAELSKINPSNNNLWFEYLLRYEDISVVGGVYGAMCAINSDIVDPVSIWNPIAPYREILVMPRELAEKILILGLPYDILQK